MIERELGAGGMATVYLAHDTSAPNLVKGIVDALLRSPDRPNHTAT